MVRKRLARLLHSMARRLDGTEGIYLLAVASMNKYISRTERYIIDLERELHPHTLARHRKRHERDDTKPMLEAGAWN